jgi:WD40 repeat protein
MRASIIAVVIVIGAFPVTAETLSTRPAPPTTRNSNTPRTLEGHTAEVSRAAFSPDGKRLASASSDRTVVIWDLQTGQPSLTLKGHTGILTGVAFSPDGKRLASSSFDKTVLIWDSASGHALATLKGHSAAVFGVTFSPDGKLLASASADKVVELWNVAAEIRR